MAFRIFVSFAARSEIDSDFARILLTRLEAQGFSVWIYESIEGQIPAGASIAAVCRHKIDETDMFVPIVSDASLHSTYCGLEVCHALARNPSVTIFPVVITQTRNWPSPFAQLVGLMHGYRVQSALEPNEFETHVEECVEGVCAALGRDYIAPHEDADRLPLRARILAELGGSQAVREKYRTADLRLLLQLCEKIAIATEQGSYVEGSHIATTLITLLHLNFPSREFYYPKIALGILSTQAAISEGRDLSESRQLFQALIDDQHPQLDANAFGGAGYVDLFTGNYASACKNYQQAYDWTDGADPAALHNLLLAQILAGENIDAREAATRLQTAIESGAASRRPGDILRLTLLYRIAVIYSSDYDATKVVELSIPNVEITENSSDLLLQLIDGIIHAAGRNEDRNMIQKALHLIETCLNALSTLPDWIVAMLKHRAAWIHFDLGNLTECRVYLSQLTSLYTRYFRFLTDEAIVMIADGCESEAWTRVREVAKSSDPADCEPAIDRFEFYYLVGLANWLQGSAMLANEYFRRSQGKFGRWYADAYPWIGDARLGRNGGGYQDA